MAGGEPATTVMNLSEHITTLAGAGGTHFLVPNLYILDLAPLFAGTPAAGAVAAWCREFNEQLEEELEGLEETLDIRIVQLKVNELIDKMVDEPEEFDLTNVTDQACGGCGIGTGGGGLAEDPDAYLWWDPVHFTRVVHKRLGAMAAKLVLRPSHQVTRRR
jgi:phospholipase/lecithinase/hemolysin